MVRKEKAIFVGESYTLTIGERLRLFRQEKGWSLDNMAYVLHYSKTHLSNVENGRSPASPDLLSAYKYRLNFDPCSETLLKPSSLMNMVHLHNPFFTGRSDALDQLLTTLVTKQELATCALVGLTGIGKTQVAIEYVYSYRKNYQAIFWLKGHSSEALMSDIANIATQLSQSTLSSLSREQSIKLLKDWLKSHMTCLLVIDGLGELKEVRAVLNLIPQLSGHIILTSRILPSLPKIPSIQLERMTVEDGTHFLLKRAGVISFDSPLTDASEEDVISASEIVKALDKLPTNIEQVGIWIKENGCALSSYLAICNNFENERRVDGR